MRADAYLFASEGRPSLEINLLKKIERFGLEAVTGRKVFRGRDRRLIVADNIVRAYFQRKAAINWGVWANENPELDALLKEAELLCQS